MIVIAAIIVVLCSSCVSGACPSGAHSTVVLPYQQAGSGGLNDTVIQTFIQNHLQGKTFLGISPDYAAVSCKQIAELKPHYHSGYYWIRDVSGAVGVYCAINPAFGESGGWMRITNVDVRNNHSQCPPGLVYNVTEGNQLCRKPTLTTPGCSSTTFNTGEVNYTKVCGRVIGYQYSDTNGFGPSRLSPGIDQTYVDGVSITHGFPRQHVWTFAAVSYTHLTLPTIYPV